jgi:hypothetical protein
MSRSAFLGSLEIINGNKSSLDNLSVTLQIKDQYGSIVNDRFGIANPILNRITAVDGTGVLIGDDPSTDQNEGIGSAQWTFVPTNLAAPEIPTQYNIGGSLSYLENGVTVTVPLLSTPITVYPQAELYLDYFHQRDVFADDPFTDDIIEPSVPYSLAVLVRNEGKGDARNLRITSGQPKIIENEKGLLIDFHVIGSEVNGQGATPSLSVNFGDIKAGKTAVADWLLKSSLQGKFIDYKATFEHVNSLGKPELSLIKDVKIHELIHTVQVAHANPDALADFLVNDSFDAQFTPDTLYFSSGGTAPVLAVKNATTDGTPSVSDLDVLITAQVQSGWTYFRLAEPSNNQLELVRLERADGSQVARENIWTTDRTFPATGRPTYENILHFLDATTAGNAVYRAVYQLGGPSVSQILPVSPDPIGTAVNTITLEFSKPITSGSFDIQDLSLSRDGGSNLLGAGVTIQAVSPTRYQISGLLPYTSQDGTYALMVNAAGVRDGSGKLGFGTAVEQWTKAPSGLLDASSPEVLDVVDLLIDPRNQPVFSLVVRFSEALDLSSFTWQDLSLTRNGGPNLASSALQISATAANTYQVSGLSALTSADGTYVFTVQGAGVRDLVGNSGAGSQGESWLMDTLAPSPPSDLVVAGLAAAGLTLAGEPSPASFTTLSASGQLRINTLTPTIAGQLEEPGLKVFFLNSLTGQTLGQAAVTGLSFSGSITLPGPGAFSLDIAVEDAAGNRSLRPLSLFADITRPVATQFGSVPATGSSPVDAIDVTFSEPIDLATFTPEDLRLTRDGTPLALPGTISILLVPGTAATYRISGLQSLTGSPGIYALRVDATGITDLASNSGLEAATTTFSITAPPSPGVTLVQTGGTTLVSEGGATDIYSLSLKTQPTAEVRISLTSTSAQLTLDRSELIFTPENWATPQTVGVSAVDDALTEGNQTGGIQHAISSLDPGYGSLTIPDLTVQIQDNDGSIAGRIWNDADGNRLNNSEAPLAGWTVFLDADLDGELDPGERFTLTDNTGTYRFDDLRPGVYSVDQVVQAGWAQTFPWLDVSTTASDLPLVLPSVDLGPVSEVIATLQFSRSTYVVKEDGTALTEVWVSRTGDLSQSVSVTLRLTDGTATGCGCAASSVNNDYNFSPITISFAPNELMRVVPVENARLANPAAIRIRDDSKAEASETFQLQLSAPSSGAVLGDQATATVTIIDNDSASGVDLLAALATTQPAQPASAISLNPAASALIGLDAFQADPRFASFRGQGFSSVIIDTGIDADHAIFGADLNLDGRADRLAYQYDFADDDGNATDRSGHGTHIASIISSIASDSSLIALKVFKDSGSGSFAYLERALQWVNANAAAYNIASVNLSLGDALNWADPSSHYGLGDEFASLASQGVLISAAAGNNFYKFASTPGLSYPGVDPNVIAVGAVWTEDVGGNRRFTNGAIDFSTAPDRIASFSQRELDGLPFLAPGILIEGARAGGGTISMGGTSQATAFVSGLATIAQQISVATIGRRLSLVEFKTLLAQSGDWLVDGDDENDNVINTGGSYPRLNALRLAEAIIALDPRSLPGPGGSQGGGADGHPSPAPTTLSLSHTINLLAGQVVADRDFSNQLQQADTTAPTATIQLDPTALGLGQTALVAITFSEEVQGFDLADLSADSGSLAELTPPSAPGGTVWTARFSPDLGVNTTANVVALAPGSFNDRAGNPGLGASSPPFSVDTREGVPAVNTGTASFAISGTAAVGNTLNAVLQSADPDGEGSGFAYTWQSSSNGTTWSAVAIGESYIIAPADAGQQLRLLVSYTDGRGFAESTATAALTVVNSPPTSSDDSLSLTADASVLLSGADFGSFADGDGDAFAAVQITTLPTSGLLEFLGVSGWQALELNQQLSAADLAAGRLRFTPAADGSGSSSSSLGFKVGDGQQFSSSAYTLRFQISPAEDLPYTTGPSSINTLNLGSTARGYALKHGNAKPVQVRYSGGIASDNKLGAGWTAVAAAPTSTGYAFYWRNSTSQQVARWNLNSSGVYESGYYLSGSLLRSEEANLSLDLNGDGYSAGPSTINDLNLGRTSLGYALKPGTAAAIQVRDSSGSAVSPASLGGDWSAVAAVAAGSGYAIYLRHRSTQQLERWDLDASGVSTASTSLSSAQLSTDEAIYNSDLNGDGFIAVGLITTPQGYALLRAGQPPLQVTYPNGNASPSNPGNGWTASFVSPIGPWYVLYWNNSVSKEAASWTLDSSGAYRLGSMLSPSALRVTEGFVQRDLNDDGFIAGSSTINGLTLGSTALGYALQTTAGTTVQVTWPGGNCSAESPGNGWHATAAVPDGSGSRLYWSNNASQQLARWSLDANGAYQSGSFLSTDQLFSEETNLNADLNADAIIGAAFSTIESQGNTSLLRRNDGMAFVQVGSERDRVISPFGLGTGDSTSTWQMLAAEIIGEKNQILWRNNPGDFLHLWTLNSFWTWQSSSGNIDPLSQEALGLETSFQLDLNRNGVIG